MPRFEFAVGSAATFREAGAVTSESFDDALEAITEQVTIRDGDTLEIGVRGFPPARYESFWPATSRRSSSSIRVSGVA